MRIVHRMTWIVVLALGMSAGSAIAQDHGEVVRVAGDYTVRVGEQVDDLVVISGSATVNGTVDGDLVVVLGGAELGGTSHVDGDVVVVGGQARIADGASIDGDLVVVAGGVEAPPGFEPRGDQVVLGVVGMGDQFAAMAPWFSQGLFWGRPVVPDLPWVWLMAGMLALLYLIINLVFERPVRACVDTLVEKPLSTGLVGLLVVLLIGPVTLVLTVSVIGIALVPLLWMGVLVAGLFGRVGVARWLGGRVVAEEASPSPLQATRSLTIGLVLTTLVYMVPVIGLLTWTALGILGVGAVATALVAGLQAENPAPPGTGASVPVSAGPSVGTAPPAAEQTRDTRANDEPRGQPPALPPDLSLLPRATFLPRLGAVALDLLLVMIALGLLGAEGGRFFVLFLIYHVVFWGWKGTTVGGIICRLRIVRSDGTPVRFSEAIVRGLSAILSVAVAGIGWLWILIDPEGQSWHDKIAGTYVVRLPRGTPL